METTGVVYHYPELKAVPKGPFPFSVQPWGINYVVSSDYTEFNDSRSKTVISLVTTVTDVPGKLHGKLPINCTKQEFLDEHANILDEVLIYTYIYIFF